MLKPRFGRKDEIKHFPLNPSTHKILEILQSLLERAIGRNELHWHTVLRFLETKVRLLCTRLKILVPEQNAKVQMIYQRVTTYFCFNRAILF